MKPNGTLSPGDLSALLYAPPEEPPRVSLTVERPTTSATAERIEFEPDAAPVRVPDFVKAVIPLDAPITWFESVAVADAVNTVRAGGNFAGIAPEGDSIKAVLDPSTLHLYGAMSLYKATDDPRSFVDHALQMYRTLTGQEYQALPRK